jgi:hypothetical protein
MISAFGIEHGESVSKNALGRFAAGAVKSGKPVSSRISQLAEQQNAGRSGSTEFKGFASRFSRGNNRPWEAHPVGSTTSAAERNGATDTRQRAAAIVASRTSRGKKVSFGEQLKLNRVAGKDKRFVTRSVNGNPFRTMTRRAGTWRPAKEPSPI